MKLGIISDTHDRHARTARAMALLLRQGIDALVHCGDVTTPEIVLECAGVPGYFVFGNNDWDQQGLVRAINRIGGVCLDYGGEFALDGKRIAVTHGDSAKEMKRLADAGPEFLLFGHTHQISDQRIGATRWINPGALHRAPRWTVAVLELETDALNVLEVDGSA